MSDRDLSKKEIQEKLLSANRRLRDFFDRTGNTHVVHSREGMNLSQEVVYWERLLDRENLCKERHP